MSCTATFDPTSEGHQLASALDLFQYQLKGVSFLPRHKQPAHGSSSPAETPYPQMPYESISEARYHDLMSTLDVALLETSLLPLSTMGAETAHLATDEVPDKFCDTAECTVL